MPSEARPYRELSDLELAAEWVRIRKAGGRVGARREERDCLSEFLRRFWNRRWEEAEAGAIVHIPPRQLHIPGTRRARRR